MCFVRWLILIIGIFNECVKFFVKDILISNDFINLGFFVKVIVFSFFLVIFVCFNVLCIIGIIFCWWVCDVNFGIILL